MVRRSVSKMKYGKRRGPSGLVSEMVKAAREAGFDMILVNKITVRHYSSKIGIWHYL